MIFVFANAAMIYLFISFLPAKDSFIFWWHISLIIVDVVAIVVIFFTKKPSLTTIQHIPNIYIVFTVIYLLLVAIFLHQKDIFDNKEHKLKVTNLSISNKKISMDELSYSSFDRFRAKNIDFDHNNFTEAKFFSNSITNSLFSFSNFNSSTFMDLNLSSNTFLYSSFIGTKIESVAFHNSLFDHSNFKNSSLKDVNFSGSNFEYVEFKNTEFIDVDFCNTTFDLHSTIDQKSIDSAKDQDVKCLERLAPLVKTNE
jgi:hypothetical protein